MYRVEYYLPLPEQTGWVLQKRKAHSWLDALEIATRAAIRYRGPIRIWFQGQMIWQTTDK